MPRKAKAAAITRDTPFTELPTLALERLANALSKHGELMYQRQFDLHLSECRVLGIVLIHEPTSLSEVCERLELDKGHVSRLVTKLVGAGLLDRQVDTADQRSAYLMLTASGRETAHRVQSAAAERNRAWMAGLPAAESLAFVAAVRRMTEQARSMLDEEERRTRAGATLPQRGALGTGAKVEAWPPRPLVVHRPVLEDMRRQLDRLLGEDADRPHASRPAIDGRNPSVPSRK